MNENKNQRINIFDFFSFEGSFCGKLLTFEGNKIPFNVTLIKKIIDF